MTQVLLSFCPSQDNLFAQGVPAPSKSLDLSSQPLETLKKANQDWGLALDQQELSTLVQIFSNTSRNPTDAELFMFAQVNSEHCRHKIFRASWTIDDQVMPHSLFDMIRNTYQLHPQHILSAYSDNAAVLQGFPSLLFYPDSMQGFKYETKEELVHTLIKVETHNHPTAVSPFPGAATGSGGEIRDEGALSFYLFCRSCWPRV
jgi:phosphoribosylformylglycinamidine synthase